MPDAGYTITEMPIDTFCYNSTYQWYGQTAGDPNITQPTEYTLRRQAGWTADGCDSFVVQPLLQLPPDALDIYHQADCSGSRYLLTAITSQPVVEWSSSPFDSTLVGHTHDRLVWVEPKSDSTTYTLTSFRTLRGDTLFCPTSKTFTISPVSHPRAHVKVQPTFLTYSNLEVTATDISGDFQQRHWAVVHHPYGDTLHLSDTLRTLRYTAPAALDSLTVVLIVNNGYCDDTATATIPMISAALWIPNVFTPGLDINNRFAISGPGLLDIDLTVYDRMGRQLFHTETLGDGWDGRSSEGLACPQGAYPWVLRYRTSDRPDAWRETAGTVTLLR